MAETFDHEFRKRICVAATRIAEAELWRGPLPMAFQKDEHDANVAMKHRVETNAFEAMIEVVLFAKVHGDEIVAQRASSPTHTSGDDKQ